MTRIPQLSGIVTVLNTPFGEDGAVDLGALSLHTERALDAGVAGFLVPALAAEVEHLTPDEREGMVRAVREVAAGRVPVIGGASAAKQAERCANAARLHATGADIVLVQQPFDNEADYLAELAEIAEAAAGPLMVQDWDATGNGVPLETLVRAWEAVRSFGYLKVETANAGPKYTALKQATGGRLHVSGGWAVMQLIEGLDRGVDAFMPTAMNRVYVEIVRRHRAGDRAGAERLFRRLLPVLAFSNQNLGHSIRFFKRLLWRQGVYPTPDLRAPVPDLDDFQARVADDLIDLVVVLEDELVSVTTQAPWERE